MSRRRQWTAMMTFVGCLQAASSVLATAPPGRYTVTADTVRDNRTELLWQRTVTDTTLSQAAAITHCTGLDLGGYDSGWRLPTRAELLSIVDDTTYSPAIDAVAFPGTPVARYWTATPTAGSVDSAWTVDFDPGGLVSGSIANAWRVRCVR